MTAYFMLASVTNHLPVTSFLRGSKDANQWGPNCQPGLSQVLDHPPYSPDPMAIDFHLFELLKKHPA